MEGLGISTKAAIFVFFITVTIMAVSGIIQRNSLRDRFYADYEHQVAYVEKIVAQSIALHVWNFDKPAIKSVGESMLKNPDVDTITVEYNEDIVSVGQHMDTYKVINKDIKFDGEVLGSVEIRFNDRRVKEALMVVTMSMLIQAAVVTLILVLCTWLGLFGLFLRNLSLVTRLLKKLNGDNADLTYRLKVLSRDELGRLAEYVNTFVCKIQGMIEDIKSNSSEGLNFTKKLQKESLQTEKNFQEVKQNLNLMNEKFEELDTFVQESSASIEEITQFVHNQSEDMIDQSNMVIELSGTIEESVQNVSSIKESMDNEVKIVKQVKDKINDGNKDIKKTNDIITKISSETSSIKEVISIINKVAAKTKFLSMNASIEAAHAGKYGTGFQVIANDVTEMSKETFENVKRIKLRLDNILDLIDNLKESSHNNSKTFSMIDKSTDDLVTFTNTISGSVTELEIGGKETLNTLTQLSELTNNVRNGSSEMVKGASQVNQFLGDLKKISVDTKARISTINDSTKSIEDVIKNVNTMANENAANVEDVNTKIGSFKTA